jgi:uncharacterized membrane protein HdeD (DUF308 family)
MDFIQALKNSGSKASSHFGWLTFLGVLNILLGLLALTFTGASTLVSVIYLGWVILASGVATLVLAFQFKKVGGFTSLFIFGILGVICGIMILRNPVENALALTLIIAILLFTSGIFRLVSCLTENFDHKGWVVFSGIISILCAYEIYNGWPFSGTWVIGTFMGIELIFTGITQLRIGVSGKRLMKQFA